MAPTTAGWGGDVVVAAPSENVSGAGTSIGALDAGSAPLRRDDFDAIEAYAVEGPPGLAVMAAALGAFGDKPDVVVSGPERRAQHRHVDHPLGHRRRRADGPYLRQPWRGVQHGARGSVVLGDGDGARARRRRVGGRTARADRPQRQRARAATREGARHPLGEDRRVRSLQHGVAESGWDDPGPGCP